MSNISQRIADLSPERRELLERQLRRERVDVSRTLIMPRRRDAAPPPLSFAQQRLWFLQQLQPDSPFYNLPSALRLVGALDTDALERSLGEIVRRHESLRTTFDIAGGEPRQVIAPARPLKLTTVDLSGRPAHERAAESQRLVDEEIRRPFDLARGPLFRARLLKLGAREHVLLLVMHHIVSDGWSMGILAHELSVLYGAFLKGEPSPLPELAVQYADYAAWQREYLTGGVLAEQLSYWRGRLGGELPALELPADRPRPPVPTYRGAEELSELDPHLSERLRELGRGEGATLFMVLLAGFYALLYRYTGEADLVVGAPVAGRTRAEVEGLIGFFVNTLALRVRVDGEADFRELLRRVRMSAVGAFAHQDVPFERVVEELRPARSTSHAPLFQVMFALQNASSEELELAGVGAEELDAETETAKFDLHLSARETSEGLTLSIRYSTDLFDAPRIRRMLAHYRRLLEAAVADPARPVSELSLLTEGESRQLLVEWNDTARDYPRDLCLHQLFEAQAARTPAAAALVGEGRRLTYAELDARADRLARRLRESGVGPEVLVGVMLGRSAELVVALLGVLKAGGAYVPLDPAYPRERLRFMLEDSRAQVLVTQAGLADGLDVRGVTVVRVDADTGAVADALAEGLRPRPQAGNLAYVIYTSGSTGRPKGVAITHRSAATLVHWAAEYFAPEELAGVLCSTSVCFDLSVFELFAPLACGGKVVLAENALALPSLEAAAEVTLINTVPSVMSELLRMGGVPASVRTVNLAGEPLKNSLAQLVYERETVRRVVNLYGPSEDTTYSTAAEAARDAETEPTIGRPVANTRAYVLDGRMQLVPAGAAGELYLGGGGLARGYLNRPALTAERFVPDPLSSEPGARLYRTGDLARLTPQGEIEFLGRLDHQVKVRGFRIELGEIEAALCTHASVRECVVAVAEEGGDKRLAAYVVPQAGPRPEAEALRARLRERLPEYMVPAAFVFLDELPLSPNGKVDRRALPAPGAARADAPHEYVAPRGPTEATLARMWADILRVGRVGVTDNFFELGGDSIKGAVFIHRLQERLGETVPVINIFQGPTVRQLAAYLDEHHAEAVRRVSAARGGSGAGETARPGAGPAPEGSAEFGGRPEGSSPSSALVMLQPRGRRPPFFCVHPAGTNALCYLDLSRQLGDEQPFYGLQSPGLGAGEEPRAGFEELAALYVAALRGVQPRGPYLLGGWSMGGLVAFEMAQQLHAQGQHVALLAVLDSHPPGDAYQAASADEETLFRMFAGNLGRRYGVEFDDLCGRTLDERLDDLRRRALAARAVPANPDPLHFHRLFSIFKANVHALAGYEPRTYPGRVTVFRAGERFADSPSDLLRGWEALAAGGAALHDTPGNHYTMIDMPHARALAESLGACIEGALAGGAAGARGAGPEQLQENSGSTK